MEATGVYWRPVWAILRDVGHFVLSQSAKLSKSAVIVPKLRFCCRFSPLASQQATQPYTLFWCTSSPAQRA